MSDSQNDYGRSPLIDILPIIHQDNIIREWWTESVARGIPLTPEDQCRAMMVPAEVLGLSNTPSHQRDFEAAMESYRCAIEKMTGVSYPRPPFTLHGMRYHQPITETCETLEDAVSTARRWLPSQTASLGDEDYCSMGWAVPTHITDLAGKVVVSEQALTNLIWE